MEGKKPEKPPERSSTISDLTDAQIDEAERNLTEALEAYSTEGEAGLQKVMDRLYPKTSNLTVEKFMTSSRSIRAPKPLPLVPYEKPPES